MKMLVYEKESLAEHMPKLLAAGHVLLLWSESHSVVLGYMQIDMQNPQLSRFGVIDPASGHLEEWSLQQVIAFTDSFVVDIQR